MSNKEDSKNAEFEPDNATSPDEKRQRLIELMTGVWQFHDTLNIKRLDTPTQKGWKITYSKIEPI